MLPWSSATLADAKKDVVRPQTAVLDLNRSDNIGRFAQ